MKTSWASQQEPAGSPVGDEQLTMVLLHTRVGTLVATAFAVLLAAYAHGSIGPVLVTGWVLVKIGVAVVRIGLSAWYDRHRGPARRWRRITHAMLAVDGAVWGVAGFVMMGQAEPVAAFVAAALAGVTCVATFGLQVSLGATASYVVPILVPTAAGLLARGDEFGNIGGLGVLMLLGLQLVTADTSQRRFRESLALRQRAEALAVEKDAALRLAQRQAAVKMQFLANISHELRTPLHGILGLARLLHVELRDAGQARRLELIESSGTHLLRLINDLLDVSRIETGHFSIRRETFELGAQVMAVADVYAVRAADKGLGFNVVQQLPPDTWVGGDPARLRQVLHNLLGNAIKFTRSGRIELAVSPGDTPELLRFEVRDTGGGIPESQLEQIFQAFHQGDATSDAAASGAGLGLTIAREIAQAMGGDIAVRSEPGIGSTFVFTAKLPRAAAAPTPAAPDQTQAPAARPVRHVLIADDDDVNAVIVGAYLDRLGIAHERVANGKEAVGRALRETERPGAILMDCRMPVMDGLAATREIRVQEAALGLPRMPIIALTATAADFERERCLEAGMDAFLTKPFTMDELSRALGTHAAEAAH